jgi:hypothetical protein
VGVVKFEEELGGREDRQVRVETEQVLVTGDEERSSADGQRKEIVVIGIGGVNRGWLSWVVSESSVASDPADIGGGFVCGDPPSELGVGERTSEFGDEQLGNDELEPTVTAAAQDLGGGPASRQDR